jgi:MscS family membrane protein
MSQVTIVLLFLVSAPLFGQADASSNSTKDSLGRTTPRGTVVGFLGAAHHGDWNSAVQYLGGSTVEDSVELAKELSVVLDEGLPANLDSLNDQPEGNLKDSLPPAKELIGTIATAGGPLDVTLNHARRGGQMIWLFSPETLKEIPAVYDEFNSVWLSQHFPNALLRRGWLAVPLWQWLLLAIGVAVALLVAAAMRKIALPLLRRVFRSLADEEDEWLLVSLTGPLRGLVSLLVLEATVSLLRLPLLARRAWFFTGGSLAIILFGWFFIRIVHVSGRLVDQRVERRGGAGATAVIRLCERTLTVLTFGFVVAFLLKQVGLIKDVSTLVAGVGVGGIAIAFAAQKTLENLFGGISIIFDKTIRVGDACKIGAQSGTVEDIGLRSTSLRTDDRTVLTVPNGQLSAMNIENLSMREKIYFRHVVGVRYETTGAQMRSLLDSLRTLLAADSRLETSTSRVRLIRFGPSSLDLEIVAYVLTTDNLRFLETQEDLLLRIMETIESAGTATAFPSQTLYLGRDRTPALRKGT